MRYFYKLSVTLLFGLSANAAQALDISGTWAVEAGNAIVEITDCGNATPCGQIAWLEASDDAPLTDTQNPDPNLRDRPLIGSPLLWGYKAKDKKWKSGKIYDAESGKTYKSKLELLEDGTLKVKGCVGPICQSQVWTRTTLKKETNAQN